MLEEDDIVTIIEHNVFLKPVRKWIISFMDFYFSINPEFTKSYESVFGDNGKVLESVQGVDTRFFHPVTQEKKKIIREQLGLPEDLFLIITVGYLVRRKGYKGIFKALSNLDIPFLYIVVGDYEVDQSHYLYHIRKEMKSLYDMGNDLLKEKILFTGPRNNVHEYLQASDVFLLNSKREGVPNALLEAMACGIPPVINHLNGIDGFITLHLKNALVFHNASEVDNTISMLVQDNELLMKLGHAASETISDEWTFNKILNWLLKPKVLLR